MITECLVQVAFRLLSQSSEETLMKQTKYLAPLILLAALTLAACGSPMVDEPAVEGAEPDTSAGMQEPAENAAESPVEEAPAEEAPMEESAPEEAAEPAASSAATFTIVSDESEARFIIDEVLSGQPKTVVGTTSDVTGSLTVDYANPAGASMGDITVDLSTLVTDNNFRNRAIQDAILQSGQAQFQFATFTPTSFSGLPDSVTIGEPVTFQITGNMTLHGVTKELTFDATVTPVSETRLEGSASTSILYQDFDVNILRLPPQVASVEDSVILEIDFVAVSG